MPLAVVERFADDLRAAEIAPLAHAVVALAALSGEQAPRLVAELDTDESASIDVAELASTIRAFCVDPSAGQPGAWLFGTI